MKSIILIISLCIIFIITGCEKKQEQQVEELVQTNEAGGQAIANDIPEVNSDYLSEIYELQERIKLDHQNIELRKKYCDKAHFPESGYVFTMGIGLLNNPETGNPIPKAMATRVAMLDAARWVGYVEMWMEEQYKPDFGVLNKQVNRPLKIIEEITLGDSLVVFYATKTDKH